ncbi:hypothetical protein ACFL0V_06775, partial [Nanoarchaeota archaeon]
MAGKKSVIETGIDKLLEVVKDSGKISVKEAARLVGESASRVEEWADFLEEEKLLTIESTFSGKFLVYKELTTKDVVVKA